MSKTLAFLHTSPVLVPAFTSLAAELLEGIRTFHMVDESLIKNTIAAGSLTKDTARRVFRHVESAQMAGADAVLVTCSSIGAAVPMARPLIDVPVMRIDEPMAEAAVSQGRKIGVAATLNTTLEPTLELLRQTADRMGRPAEMVACLCEGAFEAVVRGDTEHHDALVRTAIERLVKAVDVVVLAQASMARVVAAMPAQPAPVLSSPRLAMERAREVLA
ncbi:MAG: aspartate/glutamate racemase family protein [Acidobacteria bacterium]|nr:aspartate/glutamate racemase family protein [Acidobacteriota bacterium]